VPEGVELGLGVDDGVPLGVLLGLELGVLEGVCDGVPLGVWEGVEEGVSLGVAEALGVEDGVALGVIDGVKLGVDDGVSLGVAEGVSDGVLLAAIDYASYFFPVGFHPWSIACKSRFWRLALSRVVPLACTIFGVSTLYLPSTFSILAGMATFPFPSGPAW